MSSALRLYPTAGAAALSQHLLSFFLLCLRNLHVAVKGVDLTGLLGRHKRRLGVWGTEFPQRGPGTEPR